MVDSSTAKFGLLKQSKQLRPGPGPHGMPAFVRSKFSRAVYELGGNVDAAADVLNDISAAGDQQSRQFHHNRHFLKVSGDLKPILAKEDAARFIAGQCHDVVYCRADGGFEPHIQEAIAPYFTENDSRRFVITEQQDNPMLGVALELFGYKHGQVLNPFSGQNEFLSALYAMYACGEDRLDLEPKHQLMIMAQIEGTIPFRGPDHFEGLYTRLQAANELLPLEQRLTDQEMKQTIHTAVAMANDDVSGFDSEYEKFFKGTRELVLEFLPAVERSNPEAIRKECAAQVAFHKDILLKGMDEGTKQIFHSFDNIPPAAELKEREDRARSNIENLNIDLQKGETVDAIVKMAERASFRSRC